MYFVNRQQGFQSYRKGIPSPCLMEWFLTDGVCSFQGDIQNLKSEKAAVLQTVKLAQVWKNNCFHIWSNVSEIGRWKIHISLSLVWLPAVWLVVYLSQNVWINFLDRGLVIWVKTSMLVYPKELSDSLDCTPRISYSPCVSKSARLEPLDL